MPSGSVRIQNGMSAYPEIDHSWSEAAKNSVHYVRVMDELGPSAFDFWIGEWDCAFDGGRATNTITREFAGKVVQERFVAVAPQSWTGMSVSVYDTHSGIWRQTWVDEAGNYWGFVGALVDGNPSFGTAGPVDNDQVYKRMVFSNISDATFDWRWESSPDGAAWKVNWEIAYSRR